MRPGHRPAWSRSPRPGGSWEALPRLDRAPSWVHEQPAMASSRQGLLLLLVLLTAHTGPSEAQHWSHGWYPGGKRALSSAQDPQNALRPPAGSPAQSAHGLSSDALALLEDSMPWEGRNTAWWSLRQKQHLAQTLLTAAREPRPAPPSSNKV
uniref:progonadoliberin-2 isoform X1 n=1 Tax=Callithrix jacchus TaxID=9483 RepID=UPI0023DD62DB|nr:progonadoliberin-2 isoform X1 [Callithrix jacchus]